MQNPQQSFNPHLSVDCVVFGFDGTSLKVLLIEKELSDSHGDMSRKYKLPGDLIIKMEDLHGAAKRVLNELTGLSDIYLQQFSVFGDPGRISDSEDISWLEDTSGVSISRVVTTAYYSLIRIDKSKVKNAINNNASWHEVCHLPELAFDHAIIIDEGVKSLQMAVRHEPICFELLPRKFTLRQTQTLYEAIFGIELDNRNFRKKLLKATYIEALDEKQNGVAHKPARFYKFNNSKYKKSRTDVLYYNF